PSLKQLAVLAPEVPSKLFDAVAGLGDLSPMAAATGGGLLLDWLRAEMAYQLNRALDAHVMAQLIAAKPGFGETGTGIINQIRQAIREHRALGANPTILVASPKLAAELDTYETTTKDFPMGTRATGSASPLYGLNIVELGGGASEHAPVLVDPTILGVNYY